MMKSDTTYNETIIRNEYNQHARHNEEEANALQISVL